MKLNGKAVSLELLKAELTTAGVVVPALGIENDDLHTYDEDGQIVDVPAEAASVVAAHVPPAPPPTPDYGGDDSKDGQIAAGVANLRAYLALASPTAAQSAAALKLVIRAVFFLMRRAL